MEGREGAEQIVPYFKKKEGRFKKKEGRKKKRAATGRDGSRVQIYVKFIATMQAFPWEHCRRSHGSDRKISLPIQKYAMKFIATMHCGRRAVPWDAAQLQFGDRKVTDRYRAERHRFLTERYCYQTEVYGGPKGSLRYLLITRKVPQKISLHTHPIVSHTSFRGTRVIHLTLPTRPERKKEGERKDETVEGV